jgi:2-polyprenyl-3-methyl-5-hydroxy-6-metoxy-1,4-benzoquinol methylase
VRFFSDRGVYGFDAYWINRLNERYNHIILPNLKHVISKRILDLGAHDGRWTWAFLESGASFVTGVEGRPETAKRLITQLTTKSKFDGRYEFIVADVFDALTNFQTSQFDTICCLGIFYHIMNHDLLMKLVDRLKPEAIIIDSSMIDTDDMVIRLQYEPTSNPLNGIAPAVASIGRRSQPWISQCDGRFPRLRCRIHRLG